LSEQERLQRHDSVNLDALRAMAASMPIIEQAKGIVMACYGVDADAAFAVLSRASSSGDVKIRAPAVAVVEAVGSPTSAGRGPRPSPCVQVCRLVDGRSVSAESSEVAGCRLLDELPAHDRDRTGNNSGNLALPGTRSPTRTQDEAVTSPAGHPPAGLVKQEYSLAVLAAAALVARSRRQPVLLLNNAIQPVVSPNAFPGRPWGTTALARRQH